MRRFAPLLAAALLLTSACDRSKAQLDASVAQLQQVSAEKDSLLRDVVATSQFITEVNGELARAKGSNVGKPVVKAAGDLPDTLTPAQARKAMLDRVAALVTRLNDTEKRLASSRARVASLVKDNATAKAQIAQFDSTVNALKVLVEGQKQQVATLTEQVAALSAENATLLKEKGMLTQEKEQLTTEKTQLVTEKNTVYYIVGTRDDLVKIHVLEMTGGFIGIGRTAVPVRDLQPAAFTAIDRTKTKEIPFPNGEKSYRIVTRQDLGALEAPPTDPNEIKGGLKIADHDKFWGASKYLIVVEN
ncbi:MAG: hypothetical protein HY275_08010 [Gemmatimonadetes bacterium]|nr:hypothetical protein [Gemmatimonadota bacterium]